MRAIPALLDRALVVVIGKGGVGKSTVAIALALAAARRGRRALVVEVAGRDDVARALGSADGAYAERVLAGGIDHISVDPAHAVRDYLRRRLPLPALAGTLARSRVFGMLTAAAPGLAELLTVGKVWELARRSGHDLVVLDAPAAGHGVGLLEAPRTYAAVARVGPIAHQAQRIGAFLADRERTGVLAVAGAEELPVNETIAMREQLRERAGLELDAIVVDAVLPRRFTAADMHALEAAPPSPARHAALFAATRAAGQHAQLARLRRAAGDLPLRTLPFLFAGELTLADYELLAGRLER